MICVKFLSEEIPPLSRICDSTVVVSKLLVFLIHMEAKRFKLKIQINKIHVKNRATKTMSFT